MRILVQRVKEAQVTVAGQTVGKIGKGLLLFVGITHTDGEGEALFLAEKVAHLRIFADEGGKMNRSLLEEGGEVLSVSQFTLYGDARKGRRPNFTAAAPPEKAEALYQTFNAALRGLGLKVETGRFGAAMEVALINDGPVTLMLER